MTSSGDCLPVRLAVAAALPLAAAPATAGSAVVGEPILFIHGLERAWLTATRRARRCCPGSGFLKQLNAVDETPGAVNYGTWWSPCGEIIIPQESVILSGTQNTKTACLEHIQLSQDDAVYRGVRDFVR